MRFTAEAVGTLPLHLELEERIKREFPKVQFGYFNRTRENFFPTGYEQGWPIKP